MQLGSFWNRFINLIPSKPTYVGTIISFDGSAHYTLVLPGGGTVKAIGTGSYNVSDKVFVVGNAIQGKAPSLPTLTIEV